MTVRREKCQRSKLGIRPRLFIALAALTILFAVLLWVFQIRLLSYFYEKEKFSEMEEIAGTLSQNIGKDDFVQQVEIASRDHSVCILVFEIGDQPLPTGERPAHTVADAEAASDCLIHHLPSGQLSDIYDDTKANGDVFDRRMDLQNDFTEHDDEFRVPGFHKRGTQINAIHSRILKVNDAEYLLILDSQLTPVNAVVKTLEMQFLWIASVLLLLAVFVASLSSHIIARPLIEITKKARGLAEGNYQPDFSGKGYKEVQDLADALNYAATEIGTTDRLQKELIANISHDLRTPLTMIKGYSEMMRDIPGENSPENVQAIIDETTRLTELVNDLMDLSKLQSGMQKPNFTVFDLTATVRDTMQRYDTLISHEGYRIEWQGAEEEALVKADRTMLLQVIYNLINNAVNYTGESKHVTVIQTVANGRVRLSVKDDGEGIAPEDIPEIWDRYYRVDRVHKRSVMGTGLGLSIVKGVLEAHEALYGVESALGVGSVFWFELPLVDPEAENE